MQKVVLVSLIFLFAAAAIAQTQPSSTPPPAQPRPTPQATPPPQTPIRSDPRFGRREIENGFLNPVSESDRLSQRVVFLQQYIAPLYRKPSGKELKAVAPDPKFEQEYESVLRAPNTGIFRLLPDAGCAVNTKVISAKEDCIKYSMPGAGSSFSFRTGNYRIRHLADITYEGGELHVTGVFMHGFIADIGDVPLESVTTTTAGMKFVSDFKPSTNFEEVVEIDRSFRKGVQVNQYRYAMNAPAREGSTYAYRGVAYRGRVVRSVNGIRYNELDYDKREDVIVVFRIVEQADDGGITIVYRELSEQETPRIKRPDKPDEDTNTGGN